MTIPADIARRVERLETEQNPPLTTWVDFVVWVTEHPDEGLPNPPTWLHELAKEAAERPCGNDRAPSDPLGKSGLEDMAK